MCLRRDKGSIVAQTKRSEVSCEEGHCWTHKFQHYKPISTHVQLLLVLSVSVLASARQSDSNE